jgi:glycosyltransferase involved in cell wall biosynthesis
MGLGAKPECDLLIAESADDFINAILRLFKDCRLRNRVGAAARHFVINNYNWDLVVKRINAIQNKLE